MMIHLTYTERNALRSRTDSARRTNPTPFFPNAYLDRLARVHTIARTFDELVKSNWALTLNVTPPRDVLEPRSDQIARHERKYLADAYDVARRAAGLPTALRF